MGVVLSGDSWREDIHCPYMTQRGLSFIISSVGLTNLRMLEVFRRPTSQSRNSFSLFTIFMVTHLVKVSTK